MIVYLPGFLGQKEDFENLIKISPELAGQPFEILPYFEKESSSAHPSFIRYADFSSFTKKLSEYFSSQSSEIILVGYSMGARIALHWLLNFPQNIKKAVLVSAHTGLKSLGERLVRYEEDEELWRQLLLKGGIDALVHYWENEGPGKKMAIPEIENSIYPLRKSARLCPQKTKMALEAFSLSQQSDLEARLHEIKTPVLWLAGELDSKYAEIGEKAALQNSFIHFHKVPAAGHRCLWDQPETCLKLISDFLIF